MDPLHIIDLWATNKQIWAQFERASRFEDWSWVTDTLQPKIHSKGSLVVYPSTEFQKQMSIPRGNKIVCAVGVSTKDTVIVTNLQVWCRKRSRLCEVI